MTKLILSIVPAFCVAVAAQTRPAGTVPTVLQVREDFDSGEYSQAIRGATRLLLMKSIPPADRHELLVLKAESHLRLGDSDLAGKAFDDAYAAATEGSAGAKDRAMAILVRRSKRNVYVPRAPPDGSVVESYPILDEQGRKLALRGLYADERSADASKLAAAVASDDVQGMLDGLDAILLLRDLELAASGADAESQATLTPLSGRAAEYMEEQLKQTGKRVEKLAKSANTKKKMGSAYRKRGLAAEEVQELRHDADTATRIVEAAQRFEIAKTPEPERFTQIRRDAQQLGKRIDAVLKSDYSGLYDRN